MPQRATHRQDLCNNRLFNTGDQMAMTPKEELIQAIQRSPDDVVSAMLEILKIVQKPLLSSTIGLSTITVASQFSSTEKRTIVSKRLKRRNGVLVIETGSSIEFDINAFINELREERIQTQIGPINP
jgi:hypothetical protein